MRVQLSRFASFTHATMVKSCTVLTMPAGNVARPPVRFSAFPLTPATKLKPPLSAAVLPLPDESVNWFPPEALALYQRARLFVMVTVALLEPRRGALAL